MEQKGSQPNIDAILNGDSQAFSKLVDGHKNLVYTVALRMLKNTEEAEEVAQDTFIKVFKSLKYFKGDSKFSTWIYRIAYNTCLDRLKKNKKEFLNKSVDEITGFEIEDTSNALEDIIASEKSLLIRKCIEQLASKDAALITFFYFEEKSLKELSDILDLAENTVKVRLFRARARLALILKEKLALRIIENYG
ncbi:RNA polymerase sigma factor [Croceitalea rosinachiae]|uniref:RNA polymerase sigma factor n=1 Tax=Croceitalea rosinachiae TaxID=3075596 RepID=A0ABU3ABH9_9FLAO|nr:sigma-70 family RNA polymerase sigma factor [Croceitalea sp. F388]MDT0606917.1 sigma-70 family RNA polymerase sigma factor [Croceitalea sp. F388]